MLKTRSNRWSLAALCVASLALTGCPDYDEQVEPPPLPVPDAGYRPPPIDPPPLHCPRGFCGENVCCGIFPGSIDAPDGGLGVIWLVRVDRSLANLVGEYDSMIASGTSMLRNAGFNVTMTMVASLYDGTPLWAGGRGIYEPSRADVLRAHASEAPSGVPMGCTSTAFANLARQLTTAEVVYPPGLLPAGMDDFRPRPFEFPVADLLVVMVDHGDRTLTAYSDACKIDGVLSYDHFSPPTTTWLDGMQLPRLQTKFVLVHSAEEVPYEQYRSQCRSSGLPATALDAVEPSEIAFFRGFAEGLRAQQPTLVVTAEVCAAAAPKKFASATGSFASAWARELIDANPPPTEPAPMEPPPTP